MIDWQRRWPLLLIVSAGLAGSLSSCAVPQPVPRRPGTEPRLRIGVITGAAEVRIGGTGPVSLAPSGSRDVRLDRADEVAVIPVGAGVGLRNRDGGTGDRLRVTPVDRSRFVLIDGKPYRGSVELYARGGVVYAVNEIGLESYVRGVVAREMGTRRREERAALEAQAIVSRTYALRNIGRFRDRGFDLQAGVADQAYGGVDAETALGDAAVRATAGRVVTYRGQLITAFFHSTCGGSTAGPEEAFRTVRAVPYLVPVSDRRPGGGDYCDGSPRYRWQVEWEATELRDILRRTVPAVLGIEGSQIDRLDGIRVHRTGRSGRVSEIRVAVERGEIPVFGPDIRRVLQTPDGRPLGSTAFEFTTADVDHEAARVAVSGGGWGHGVGMCQWGAIGRARAGQDARTIIAAYFRGGRIESWY